MIRSFAQHKIMEERNEILKISLAALMRRFASTRTHALAETERKENKNCHASQSTDYMRCAVIKTIIDDICHLSWHSPRALIVWTFKSRSAVNTKKSRPVCNHNVLNRTTKLQQRCCTKMSTSSSDWCSISIQHSTEHHASSKHLCITS